MNINVQNPNNRVEAPMTGYAERADRERSVHAPKREKQNVAEAANVSFYAGEIGFTGLGAEEGKGKAKTFADIQQEASVTDVGISQDYMTLMSHTMSAEDYQKLSDEGFHFESLDPEKAVTIVDRIKAELARSGKQIVGYTDDIDMETLAAAVGSDTLARAISDSFQAADIPMTKENIADVAKAWDMATQLGTPTDGACQFLIDNEMEPEIWNLYLAQNSGAGNGKSAQPEFLNDPNMKQQIDLMLSQSGLELNEKNRQAANWLLERALPLTSENLARLQELQDMTFPVEEEVFAEAAAEAVAAGQSPVQANLAEAGKDRENLYEKAADTLENYRRQYRERDTTQIAARRQLEEIRLRMTAEINVKLLKSGFAIDTAPMEELITALREMEKEVAGQYFPDDENAVAKYENWNSVTEVMDELPAMPAQLLAVVRLDEMSEATTLSRFHAEGRNLQENYRRAGESYEALMTAPRADLGDSMRKAFANVDDILRDMDLELTDENRRAVRILGYNRMSIDPANIERVLEADACVKNVIEKMTPAATLQMIRDGVNPLEQSFAQLEQYFDDLPESYRDQAESYSRYLYGLEQSKQITAEERESYIGVYRLLRQIERSDGAAIGAVVNVRAEMQFSNLLSAVRSGKFRHLDVKASDELGVLQDLVRKGESLSISEQISGAYQKQRLEEARSAVQAADSAVVSMLERGEMPANTENLLAAQGLLRKESNPFKTLREKAEKLRSAEEARTKSDPAQVWEALSDKEAFRADYEEMLSGLQEEAEELTLDYAQESLDVRSLRLTHRQLSVMGGLAANEEYFLSMYVGEELAAVHLTLEHTGAEKGGVSIAVDLPEGAHVEAHLQVKDGRVEGFLLGNTQEEVTKLQTASDIFSDLIREDNSLDLETAHLPVVSKGNINVTGTSGINSQEEATSPDNGMLYHVAKLFLQAIR